MKRVLVVVTRFADGMEPLDEVVGSGDLRLEFRFADR